MENQAQLVHPRIDRPKRRLAAQAPAWVPALCVVWLSPALAASVPATASASAAASPEEPAPTVIYTPTRDDDVWTSYRPLIWDDFRGSLEGWGIERALLASTILVEDPRIETQAVDGGYRAHLRSIKIFAAAHKLESAKKSGGKTDYTLRHEQGHFDVTEIGARRLRAQVRTLSGTGPTPRAAASDLQAKIDAAFQTAWHGVEQMQRQYDGETRNGRAKGKQKAWWKKLEGLLRETAAEAARP